MHLQQRRALHPQPASLPVQLPGMLLLLLLVWRLLCALQAVQQQWQLLGTPQVEQQQPLLHPLLLDQHPLQPQDLLPEWHRLFEQHCCDLTNLQQSCCQERQRHGLLLLLHHLRRVQFHRQLQLQWVLQHAPRLLCQYKHLLLLLLQHHPAVIVVELQ